MSLFWLQSDPQAGHIGVLVIQNKRKDYFDAEGRVPGGAGDRYSCAYQMAKDLSRP